MSPWELLIAPFVEFMFMRRALVGCIAMGIGAAPLGVLLLLRRMSLIGDAMAHAILPGAAIGFLVAGYSLSAMTLGGLVAGLIVALLAGTVARLTLLREDASLAGFYLLSLAAGVLIVSMRGSNVDLLHVLFGTVLALDDSALLLIGSVASATGVLLAIIYRPLVVESFDPEFLRSVSRAGPIAHLLFLVLVVLNLVAGFHALGTLMVVGIMMLPAAAARFWADDVGLMMTIAIGLAVLSSIIGILLSYHAGLPTGPAIILTAGLFYVGSLLLAPRGSLTARLLSRRHLEA